MTKKHYSINSAADNKKGPVYINLALFEELSRFFRFPHTVSVMLTLMSNLESNGVVRTTQATVALQCSITLQDVDKAIADLANAGLISSVEVSNEPGGSLSCVMSPDFARSDRPEEL